MYVYIYIYIYTIRMSYIMYNIIAYNKYNRRGLDRGAVGLIVRLQAEPGGE